MDSILSLLGSGYNSSAYASIYSSLYGTSDTSSIYEDLYSSIYGTEEDSTGSLDTEALVESSVSGIRQKIERLENERTKVEWEQEAYQSLIDRMSDFDSKYTSGTASTDLLSNSFWNSAVSAGATGANAGKLSASGVITTDVQVLGIKQLAQGAVYTVSGTIFGVADSENGQAELDAGKTLRELLDEDVWDSMTPSGVNEDGEAVYDFVINGKAVGSFTKDTALESVMVAINGSADSDVSVSYSQTTNQFLFRADETGSASTVELGDGLAQALFGGGTAKAGQDAVFSLSVNGQELLGMTQSGNSVTVDGLTIHLKGTFNYDESGELEDGEAVGFEMTADADRIVDAVKAMVEDYNALVSEVKAAYSTMPASEEEIAEDPELAKQGILFADNDVRALYEDLREAVTENGFALSKIGISTEYSDGLTILSLDEDSLRAALADDPETVQETLSSEGGIMDSIKDTLDTYGDTGGGQGVLVEMAGSASSSYGSQSVLQKELEEYDDQIAALEETLASKIDYYTSQYTMLDLFITQLNTQSTSLLDMLNF